MYITKIKIFIFSVASCPELANITSASLNITTNGQTTKAVYTCDDGYEIDGNAIITCLTNGSWNSEPPLCCNSKKKK